MAEISLLVDGQVFKANKDVLCKHSDYFRAMFSGNYVENDKQEISIHVIDAESMKTILDYMNTGSTVLYEHSIANAEKLETAARFLLMTELVKDIEYFLLSREIMSVSQDPLTIKPRDTLVEHGCAKYRIVPFKSMKPEYITDITTLCWYLSHPCIDASSELDVFIFGYNWIVENKTGDDAHEALLMILGCLDLKKLTAADLSAVKTYIVQNSMAAKVVKYLHSLARRPGYDLSVDTITSSKTECAETIYNETLKLVEESKSRHKYTPIATLLQVDKLEIYKLTEKGFEMWQELPGLCQFVFVISWRLTKLVMVNETTKSVWVYDVLEKEWECHGEGLWRGCHDEACIVGDSLFIINFRPHYHRKFSTTIYDLNARVFVTKARLDYPEYMRSDLVQFCVHEGAIYTTFDGIVYKRDDLGSVDRWSKVDIQGRIHRMVSFKGYIYCSMAGLVPLYRFRPGVDHQLEDIEAKLNQCPVHICNLGDRILFLCHLPGWFISGTRVDEFYGNIKDEKLRECHINRDMEADNIISFCPLVVDIPLYSDMSNYVKEYLKKYEAIL